MNIIVWHRKDLRVEDNRALYEASRIGKPLPVYIFDPRLFSVERPHCDDRYIFLFECLADLDDQYKKIGSGLSLLWGDPVRILKELTTKYSAIIFFNHDTSHGDDLERDKRILSIDGSRAWTNDGVLRGKGSREGWFRNCEQYFEDPELRIPSDISANNIPSEIKTRDLIRKFSIHREKRGVPKGGKRSAKRKLNYFIDNMDSYMVNLKQEYIVESANSELSPYISLGVLSLRTIYREVNKSTKRSKDHYINRLFWNQHHKQMMQDFPDLAERAVNPVFDLYYEKIYSYDPDMVSAWKNGNTGFPVVDASMRALADTGFINFSLRKMVSSFFCYIMKQPWKIGADHMYHHLIDADCAINYSWWQIIAGTVGAYDNVIYDPKTFSGKFDPEGIFIKEYIPELKNTNMEYISMPWKISSKQLNDTETGIHREYVRPVVDFEYEYNQAVNIYRTVNIAAVESFRDPELLKRASLYGVIKKRVVKGQLPEIIRC